MHNSTRNLYHITPIVYIAGVRIHVTSVNITAGMNSIPQAAITVPPSRHLDGIGQNDRVPVHVFIKDIFTKTSTTPKLNNETINSTDKILLFDGEITSVNYHRSGDMRTCTITAQHVGLALQDVKIKNSLSNIETYTLENVANTQSGSTSAAVAPKLWWWSFFYEGLPIITEAGKQNTPIKSPVALMHNILQYIGLGDVNDKSAMRVFYKGYSERIQLMSRVVAVPYFDSSDPTVSKYGGTFGDGENGVFAPLRGMQISEQVQSMAGRSSGLEAGTAYDFVNVLSNQMEYEVSILSSPKMRKENGKVKALNQFALKPLLYEALPPKCNVLFKTSVIALTYSNQVHAVPTRIIADGSQGIMSALNVNNASAVSKITTTFSYPEVSKESIEQNIIAPPLKRGEEFTGPYVQNIDIPSWIDWVPNDASFGLDNRYYARHMYLLTRNTYKRATVTTVFNPYVTPGYNCIVLDDNDGESYILIGMVTSVSHSISSGGTQTEIQLTFPRTYTEEKVEPLTNTIGEVTAITQDLKSIDNIYQHILGCGAVNILDPEEMVKLRRNHAQRDLQAAYQYNHRDITTLEDYFTLLNKKDPSWWIKNGGSYGIRFEHDERIFDSIKLNKNNDYLTRRFDTKLQTKLKAYKQDIDSNKIYM